MVLGGVEAGGLFPPVATLVTCCPVTHRRYVVSSTPPHTPVIAMGVQCGKKGLRRHPDPLIYMSAILSRMWY